MPTRERLIEIVVACGAVAVMYALLFYVGASHARAVDGGRELTETGGVLVVYAVAAFVVVMAVAGMVLLYTVTVVEAENEAAADA